MDSLIILHFSMIRAGGQKFIEHAFEASVLAIFKLRSDIDFRYKLFILLLFILYYQFYFE